MLDSDVLIDILNQMPRAIYWYQQQQGKYLAITPIVWMEVVSGARNKTEQGRITQFLKPIPMEYPTIIDFQWAITQIAQFHLSHGLQLEDAIIASVAVRLGVPLYTRNVKHFTPLPALDEQQPY